MTFSQRQLAAAASHFSAAARYVFDAIANPRTSVIGTEMQSSLIHGELEKAARALGYRLERNGNHNCDDDEDGSD